MNNVLAGRGESGKITESCDYSAREFIQNEEEENLNALPEVAHFEVLHVVSAGVSARGHASW